MNREGSVRVLPSESPRAEKRGVFDLRKLLPNRKERSSSASPEASPATEPVKLVAVTTNAGDEAELRRIAAECGWNISVAKSSAEAVSLLQQSPVPLVICDRDLPEENWREALAQIAGLPQAVCVLLASAVVDEYLWNEVIQNHGYDVVTKPYRREDLMRAVTFAWSWRGWACRQRAEASGQ
jgi:CheY-like chemotaxis protein